MVEVSVDSLSNFFPWFRWGRKKPRPEADKKDGGGGVDIPMMAVMKLEYHCLGCALKVKRFAKRLDGVEKAWTEVSSGTLRVVGKKIDPWKIRESVEAMTKKTVELTYPSYAKKLPGTALVSSDAKKVTLAAAAADQKKPAEEPTVLLNIRLHCDDCTRKMIEKIEGVVSISFDVENDPVTVMGTMEVNTLPTVLTEKLNRSVRTTLAKDGGDGGRIDKKADAGGDDISEKKKKAAGGGGDIREKKKKAAGDGREKNKGGGESF